jgi:hypothetical protein
VPAFGPDTPVLVPDRVRRRARTKWLLWPALQYRVVTPLVGEPVVNAFQRGLLGLARAGQRDMAVMADLLGLEADFAELVRDDLRTLRYLDEFGALTAGGLDALADGFLDPHRIVVTHVYQDPFTGTLWPATVSAPMLIAARWRTRERAELDLGTTGATVAIRPLAVSAEDTLPSIPAADEIVEAVSRGNRASTRGEDSGGWSQRPPERVATRVSLVTAGQPVYLPVIITLLSGDSRDGGTGTAATWFAFSPFSRKPSHLLRRLIAIRCGRYPPLRREVESLIERPAETLLSAYDQLGAELHARYSDLLDRGFGSGLREHHELVELLTLVELNTALAGRPGAQAGELSAAVHAGWQIQEIVLRDILRRHPARLAAWQEDPNAPFWQRLMAACERIGLLPTQYKAISVIQAPEALARRNPDRSNTPELLAAAVISADQGDPEHPVRRLARQRPTLLTDLTRASQIRNDAVHAALVRIDLDLVKLSRRLAHETVAAFLRVPVPDDIALPHLGKDHLTAHE